jgi:ribose/xylose/arabinose/galactoside ABC-type transport system permease subunit
VPRQIIDTESSRPAYVRRRTRRFVVSLLVFIALVAAIWFLAHKAAGQESRAPGGTASQCQQKGVPCAR